MYWNKQESARAVNLPGWITLQDSGRFIPPVRYIAQCIVVYTPMIYSPLLVEGGRGGM